jgi:hypothetical protein
VEEVTKKKKEDSFYAEAWRIICVGSFPDPDILDPLL